MDPRLTDHAETVAIADADDDQPSSNPKHKARPKKRKRSSKDKPKRRPKKRRSKRFLKTHYPELFAQLHPTKNDGVDFENVTTSSHKLLWWTCAKCNLGHHVWQTAVYVRTRGSGCPYCCHQIVCPCDSLGKHFPDLVKELVGGGNPEDLAFMLAPGSNEELWWRCPAASCDHHLYKAAVHVRTRGGGCPFCVGQQTCPCNSLGQLHPELLKEFIASGNQETEAFALAPKSHQEFWWKCLASKCDHHVFKALVCDRTRGNGCPFCSGRQTCPCQSLGTLYPDLLEEFVAGGNAREDAFTIAPGSGRKVMWKSECGHDAWEASVCNRTGNGTGCPNCRYKSEQACREILERLLHPRKFKRARPKWLQGLEMDGINEDLKLGFEYDGRQHKEYHAFFHRDEADFRAQQERDVLKRQLAVKLGVALLEIPHAYDFRNLHKLETFIHDWLRDHGYVAAVFCGRPIVGDEEELIKLTGQGKGKAKDKPSKSTSSKSGTATRV